MVSQEPKHLGRSLGSLLSAGIRPASTLAVKADPPRTLPITSIAPGKSQPRRTLEQVPLEELAASIAARGVLQPILVRPVASAGAGAPTYEIVAGERRWRASQIAGMTEIPVVIQELSDQDAVAVALIENIQREQLTPAEEARAFRRLIEEFSLTHQLVADTVGRSRAAVSNLMRLLDLPDEVVALVDSRALSMGQARALLSLETDADRIRIAGVVVQRGLSVRATEKLVRDAVKGAGAGAGPQAQMALSVVSEVLKTDALTVRLHQHTEGGAKILVDISSPDPRLRDAILRAIKSAAASHEEEGGAASMLPAAFATGSRTLK
jgi:ParB family chromosome partitioning protein